MQSNNHAETRSLITRERSAGSSFPKDTYGVCLVSTSALRSFMLLNLAYYRISFANANRSVVGGPTSIGYTAGDNKHSSAVSDIGREGKYFEGICGAGS